MNQIKLYIYRMRLNIVEFLTIDFMPYTHNPNLGDDSEVVPLGTCSIELSVAESQAHSGSACGRGSESAANSFLSRNPSPAEARQIQNGDRDGPGPATPGRSDSVIAGDSLGTVTGTVF